MKEGVTIQDIHTRFTIILNEIYSLTELISIGKAIIKFLSVLQEPSKSKVEAIIGHRNLDTLEMDELIENHTIYALKKNKEKDIENKRKDKTHSLKSTRLLIRRKKTWLYSQEDFRECSKGTKTSKEKLSRITKKKFGYVTCVEIIIILSNFFPYRH